MLHVEGLAGVLREAAASDAPARRLPPPPRGHAPSNPRARPPLPRATSRRRVAPLPAPSPRRDPRGCKCLASPTVRRSPSAEGWRQPWRSAGRAPPPPPPPRRGAVHDVDRGRRRAATRRERGAVRCGARCRPGQEAARHDASGGWRGQRGWPLLSGRCIAGVMPSLRAASALHPAPCVTAAPPTHPWGAEAGGEGKTAVLLAPPPRGCGGCVMEGAAPTPKRMPPPFAIPTYPRPT